jgi:hypothetical protein
MVAALARENELALDHGHAVEDFDCSVREVVHAMLAAGLRALRQQPAA